MNCRTLVIAMFAIVFLPAFVLAQKAVGPTIGSQVEDFSIVDQFGKEQKLSALLADGPVALVVLRSVGWCSQCKDQLIQLQRDLKSIEASGLQLVGLSYDKASVLKDFSALNGIEFSLLADPKSKLIEQLGILNDTRKKSTLRYRVAYPMTILIGSERKVTAVVKGGSDDKLHSSQQLMDAWKAEKPAEPKRKKMGFVKVLKNRFVVDGKPVVFKGVAIADPDKIVKDGHWNKKHFEQIKSWGANVIRIPIHPTRMRSRGLEESLKLFDQAVSWCGELEMYVIIDWHSIGNLRTKKFEADIYVTNMKETLQFWEAVSKRFAGNPTVAFYEIFNEPTLNNGELGTCTWPQWKAMVEKIVDVIYANDKNVVPLVSGFNWAYDLREVKNNPIGRPGIAYVTHPYPGKCKPPREPHWEEHFGFLASRYPVFATEMGYALVGQYDYMIDDGSYRNAVLKYFKAKDISWCAWIFDPDWSPGLIKGYQYEPSHSGAFFRDAMLGDK